jgi:hypothetical protein
MFTKASHHLTAALVSFLTCIIPCIFLAPDIFLQDLGLSNYGVNPRTIVLFFLAFMSSAYFIARAGKSLRSTPWKSAAFKRGLYAVAALSILLLVIPDSKNDAVRHAHVLAGMTLFGFELVLTLWLTLFLPGTWIDAALLGLQGIACVSAYLSLGHVVPLEAPSQLVFELCFIILAIRAAQRLKN